MKNLLKNLGEGLMGFGALALVFLLLIGLVKFIQWQEERSHYHQVAYNQVKTYIPIDGGYHVSKESLTTAYNNGDTITHRSIRLIPTKINTFFADSTGLEDITLWDNNNDGKWDELFICGYPTSKYGANSIVLGKDIEDWQNWTWSPCPADKDMKPFDACTIQHILDIIKQTS